jgi:hypothetical protein
VNVDRIQWKPGPNGLALGRALFEQIPLLDRPAWAGGVLVVATTAVVPIREVEDLLRITESRLRWREAHAQFTRLRTLTLAAEQARDAHPMYKALLRLAETVAKVTYNSAGAPAPFDVHAGWRLASDARQLAEFSQDREFEARLWRALSGQITTPAL